MMSKKASSKVTSPASAADSGRSCHPYEPSDLRNLSSELRRLLVRRAIRVVRTQEDAEDVAHAAILRALTERARGNPAPRSWLGWLNTVTRHVSLDHMRRRSRTVATTRVEHLTHVDGNQHEYWRMVSDELLQEGLDTLSKPQRVAFEMHFIARLDYRTIAARTDVPVGTVSARIARARSRLKHFLLKRLIRQRTGRQRQSRRHPRH